MTHQCCVHGPEEREPRFAELDALIRAGWGNVPCRIIERMKRKNRGVLPEKAPPGYYETDEETAESRAEKIRQYKHRPEVRAAQSKRQMGKEKNDHRKMPPEQVAEALRLAAEGLSYSAISRAMGVTFYKVRWSIRRATKNGTLPQVPETGRLLVRDNKEAGLVTARDGYQPLAQNRKETGAMRPINHTLKPQHHQVIDAVGDARIYAVFDWLDNESEQAALAGEFEVRA